MVSMTEGGKGLKTRQLLGIAMNDVCDEEPHKVDVHISRTHPELAYVLIQRISLKPKNGRRLMINIIILSNLI